MIERLLAIEDPEEQDRLWKFYDQIFQPVNELTPITQTFPKASFSGFLANPRAVKFVVREEGEIVALAIVADPDEWDSWLSPTYFAKNYPGKIVFHVPVIAIAPKRRGGPLAVRLVKAIINEAPDNAVVTLTHSELVNPFMLRLVKATGVMDYAEGGKIDAEACLVFQWKAGKVQL